MAKKRANGEGSIRKKPNGRWEGRYTQGIDPSTGRAIQKSVSAKTRAECKEKLDRAIRDNRGIPVNHNEDYTVAEWCRLWFETYSKPVIRPNTAKTYENMIENHIVPAIGGVKLKRLTAIQIQKMYNDSKTKGRVQRFEKKTDTALSGSTVRRIHMVLSSALKQAVKERIIPYNPCDNCRIPPKEHKEMTIIPPEKTDDGKITIGGLDANIWMTKYGNVYTDCKAKDFMGKLGFSWGDLVTVKFLDKTLTLPVVPTYSYVDSGKPAIIVEKDADGKPTGYVSMAINMGNFAETYELAKKHTNEDKTWYWTAWEGVTYPVEVTFKMAEKGGYMAEYIMHDLQRTNDRADYPDLSDAEFGNFRNIATTGMGKDVLYRGSSPINPELGRNTYVDAALKQAGVNVIMNLANSPEEAEAYEGFADTYYSGQKVIYLNLGVDFSAPEFQKGLAEGLRFFAANKGTYYVHCTEGKDRAGFVSALLECLMGATYDEVVADYMVTYYNYYGVEPGTDKYDAIANSNIIKTLQNAFGVEDLSKADLQKGAKDYMKAIGLTDAEITDLMVNLGYVAPVEPVTPSKPATGDAGIVVYLGLGVMALAGGVLVAKKKEQF